MYDDWRAKPMPVCRRGAPAGGFGFAGLQYLPAMDRLVGEADLPSSAATQSVAGHATDFDWLGAGAGRAGRGLGAGRTSAVGADR